MRTVGSQRCLWRYHCVRAILVQVAGHLGARLPATPPPLPRPNGAGQPITLCLCTGPQPYLQALPGHLEHATRRMKRSTHQAGTGETRTDQTVTPVDLARPAQRGHGPSCRRETGQSPWSQGPRGAASAARQVCPARPHNRDVDHRIQGQLGSRHVPRNSLDRGKRPRRHHRDVEENNRDMNHQVCGNSGIPNGRREGTISCRMQWAVSNVHKEICKLTQNMYPETKHCAENGNRTKPEAT